MTPYDRAGTLLRDGVSLNEVITRLAASGLGDEDARVAARAAHAMLDRELHEREPREPKPHAQPQLPSEAPSEPGRGLHGWPVAFATTLLALWVAGKLAMKFYMVFAFFGLSPWTLVFMARPLLLLTGATMLWLRMQQSRFILCAAFVLGTLVCWGPVVFSFGGENVRLSISEGPDEIDPFAAVANACAAAYAIFSPHLRRALRKAT